MKEMKLSFANATTWPPTDFDINNTKTIRLIDDRNSTNFSLFYFDISLNWFNGKSDGYKFRTESGNMGIDAISTLNNATTSNA